MPCRTHKVADVDSSSWPPDAGQFIAKDSQNQVLIGCIVGLLRLNFISPTLHIGTHKITFSHQRIAAMEPLHW